MLFSYFKSFGTSGKAAFFVPLAPLAALNMNKSYFLEKAKFPLFEKTTFMFEPDTVPVRSCSTSFR